MPSNSYDLVVLGDDLAALVCATSCARRGMRTLVLGDDRPARYTLGPHRLPIEPVMWPSQPGTAADRVLKELHAELALRRKLREPKLAAQIVAPDLRLDLGADRLGGELERELGADAPAWLSRWEKTTELARLLDPLLTSEHAFPGVGFFERREVGRLGERALADATAGWSDAEAGAPPASQVWRHLAAIALRHPSPSAPAMARALDAWRSGPFPLRGDGDGLRELLVEKLTTAGGEVRAGRVSELGVSWGKIASITLASGDDIGAGQVVASRPPAELATLLGKKAPKRLSELAQAMQVIAYRYALNIVLDEAGLPEHMAPIVCVLGAPDKDPVGDAAFSIHLGESDDTGRVIATVSALLPADPTELPLDADKLAPKCIAYRQSLWKRIGDVMPFFERHLVLAHSPFEPTPPQVPGGRGSYDVPKHLPLAMTPVWAARAPENAVDRITGSALTYTTGIKNLTLTGEQVLPALGLEGALAAGWSAAKLACAIGGKKKDYLRDEVVGAAS
ncbi:MAG: hypothetical protein JNL83_15780 [Myxococcales bacterium]|nr:hypothetical protein [Myxococcales bacterium]